MKLPIKKRYFDLIEAGKKKVEFRDAHITFVCEETGRILRKEVRDCRIIKISDVQLPIDSLDLFDDKNLIEFELE